MRRVSVASAIALGVYWVPAHAQTVIYTEPNLVPGQIYPTPQPQFGTQPVYVDPQPPYGQQQPAPQPNYGQPLPQPQQNFGQPLPQPQPNYGQPLPQPQQRYGEPAQPLDNFGRPITRDSESDFGSVAPQPVGETQPTPAAAGVQTRASATRLGAPTDRAPGMASELDDLLRMGERYRAASPGFLDDLKALADRYREPLPVAAYSEPAAEPDDLDDEPGTEQTDLAMTETVPPAAETLPGEGLETVTSVEPLSADSLSTVVYLEDDFSDGDFDTLPQWQVRQGNWTIDPKYGLRAAQSRSTSNEPIKPKEILNVLLGGDAPASGQSSDPKAALIEAQATIANAFSFAARITDHEGKGAAHFIMHQGGSDWLGYRLEIRSGPRPVVVLTRRGSSGYKDITKVEAPGFTVGKSHELRWARLSDGQMFVILNGEPLITSRDTVFRGDWSGFAFFNAGGDVSLRAVRVAMPIER